MQLASNAFCKESPSIRRRSRRVCHTPDYHIGIPNRKVTLYRQLASVIGVQTGDYGKRPHPRLDKVHIAGD